MEGNRERDAKSLHMEWKNRVSAGLSFESSASLARASLARGFLPPIKPQTRRGLTLKRNMPSCFVTRSAGRKRIHFAWRWEPSTSKRLQLSDRDDGGPKSGPKPTPGRKKSKSKTTLIKACFYWTPHAPRQTWPTRRISVC